MALNIYPKRFSFKKIGFTVLIALIGYSAQACYADFSYTNGCVGDTVFFTAADGFAVYTWDYGDTASGADNISHDVNGYHVFTAPGDYYVTLFVNIGAEWDYRTNIIHIGSNCFQAGFNAACMGSLYMNFTDNSTGTHDSQLWTFGDPSAGAYDTSYSTSSYHSYSAPGNYVVTLVIGNNGVYDTVSQSIYVDTVCNGASINNATMPLPCINDSVPFYVTYYSGNITYTHWNFADPGSGAANTSTEALPYHQFSAAGVYVVTLVYGDGSFYDTLTKVITVVDCNVWAGDCNMDGEVNGEDIFPLGIYNGESGAQRIGAGNNWNGQPCASWNTNGWTFMYLQDLVDMKMADCNGDGHINAQDVQSVQANYGKRHTNRNNRSAMLYHNPTDPTLALQPSTNTINAGGNLSVTVSLGDVYHPATNLYGGSLTILFDPSKVDPNALVNFTLGWVDTAGNNALITFSHEDYANGRLELAFVKTDRANITTYGNIATVTFHTKSSASGPLNLTIDGNAKVMSNSNYSGANGNQEVFHDVTLQNAAVTINNPNSVPDVTSVAQIQLYPNPSNGTVYVQTENVSGTAQMDVFNAMGQKVFSMALNLNGSVQPVQLPALATGVYNVAVHGQNGETITTNRLTIIK